MIVPSTEDWIVAIAIRVSDEWEGQTGFPQDAKLLKDVLIKTFRAAPDEALRLVGTGIIEESYFDTLN